MDTLNQNDRDRILAWTLSRRRYVASELGLGDDMRSEVLLAMVEAEQSYDPEGGRTLGNWVLVNAEWAAANFLRAALYQDRNLAENVAEDEMPTVSVVDPTTAILVRNALEYLRAKLGSMDWTLLWLRHAEGYGRDDLARLAGMKLARSMNDRLSEIERKAADILRGRGIVGVHG